ncbi:hypothetical protein KR51_00015700 [Rubidibacter lacunae KORDI 51-2]|uniref:Sulfatase-modifying factor enzyme-like domain-containing protein n=1 Tax=Rubidibacter lacunae KORDI 51-2 TaxID=582515 RepID=U5DMB0_9CHRO|nr:formylglycine-generating enzyme family protein [Rubidibacter lacunae]ERN41724.1 hypothetical protein KR51_00015700 [Rubidibacter lacunae KORDI 51-2]
MVKADRQPRITYDRQQVEVQFFREQLDENVHIKMMSIPGGTFLMGSPESELERLDREGPQHEVSVPPFFMGKYPVTQTQWRIVAATFPQVNRKLNPDPSHFKGSDRPVEQVNWYEAVEFCDRLAAYTERPYRLPSEAEWEYACRAGTTTPFHFGETITTELANYRGTDLEFDGQTYSGAYGEGPHGEYREGTTPVGQFAIANEFGLCDIHGNVYEWCQDQYHERYDEGVVPCDGSAWENREEGETRILRGGSWYVNPRGCCSAYRFRFDPGVRGNYFGFRVACAAPRT